MTEQRRRLVERITDPAYVDALDALDVDALKAKRDECREAEIELSFERRLCQARIEILRAELERRERGEEADDLVARLPEILAGGTSRGDAPLPDRAPDFTIPRNADIPRRRVDEVVGDQTLARLPHLGRDEIKRIGENLEEWERSVSARRKEVQTILDRLQDEIVRRYKSGEADPGAVLGG
jgi:hypothetical protein